MGLSCPLLNRLLCIWPYNKLFFGQTRSVKIAECTGFVLLFTFYRSLFRRGRKKKRKKRTWQISSILTWCLINTCTLNVSGKWIALSVAKRHSVTQANIHSTGATFPFENCKILGITEKASPRAGSLVLVWGQFWRRSYAKIFPN